MEFGVVTKSQCQVAVNHSNFTLNAWLGKLFICYKSNQNFSKNNALFHLDNTTSQLKKVDFCVITLVASESFSLAPQKVRLEKLNSTVFFTNIIMPISGVISTRQALGMKRFPWT